MLFRFVQFSINRLVYFNFLKCKTLPLSANTYRERKNISVFRFLIIAEIHVHCGRAIACIGTIAATCWSAAYPGFPDHIPCLWIDVVSDWVASLGRELYFVSLYSIYLLLAL